MQSFDERIPATILTGFLGSGKTTLLNRILKENHGLSIAVIVNEFGEVSIDHELVIGADEEVVELANGCICCSVRGDLEQAVLNILKRQPLPEYIVVETTGLADPRPVAQTFLLDDISEQVKLDGIITVVDAENFERNIKESGTTVDQIMAGDILLLNKSDLVDEKRLDTIGEEIHDMNPAARILRTSHGKADLRLLLDVGVFQLERLEELSVMQEETCHDPHCTHQHHGHHSAHIHEEDISSVSFRSNRPFDYEKLGDFMENLPSTIFRGKGILWLDGYDEKLIFHLVGDRSQAIAGDLWGEDEMRENKLVFIGKHLDANQICSRLESCLVE